MDNGNFVSVQQMYEDFKNETAKELGIDLKSPNLTAKDAGKVGAQMMKKYRKILLPDKH